MMVPDKLLAMKRINEEFKKKRKNPLTTFGITVGLPNKENIFEWNCTILGPRDSYYSGGIFYLKITFPENYPMKKPEIVFLTPIYHLNVVYSTGKFQPLGHICLSSLNDWRPEYTLKKILPEIFALFNKNNPDSSYDDFQNTRRNEFTYNRLLFEKKAKYFTKKYARPGVKIEEYPNGWDFTYDEISFF